MPPKRKTKTQTVKKPLVETQNHDDNLHDEAEKIVEDPKDTEIAKLQEEIRLLKIENESLRKNNDEIISVENASTPNVRRDTVVITPTKARRNSTETMKFIKEKGCSCSGNCANKKCGCVKKDTVCSEFCKCASTCQNQIVNIDENKENISERKITQKNNTSKHGAKSHLSASSSESSDNASIQTKIANIDEKKESKNNISKTKITQQSHNFKRRVAKNRINTSSTESSDSTFIEIKKEEGVHQPQIESNPMKPTRQLPRSPLHQTEVSPNSTPNTTVFNDDDVFLPVPKEEVEDELPPPEEIYQVHVDWEEHQKNLVNCSKCMRRFHKYRVKKHEKSCLQI